jgi:AcrR family transcriptional regulator
MPRGRPRSPNHPAPEPSDVGLGDAVLRVLAGEDRQRVSERFGIPVRVLELAESTFIDAGERALSTRSSLPSDESRRQSILRVAARFFAERGYPATKIEDVADEMGITRPAVYYYFRNKDELFTAVIEEAIASFGDPFDRTVAAEDDLTAVLVETLKESLAQLIGEKLNFFQVLLWEIRELPRQDVAQRVTMTRDRTLAGLTRLLEIGLERDEVRVSPPDLAATTLTGFINSAPRWYDSSRGRADTVIDIIIGLATRGILADKVRVTNGGS